MAKACGKGFILSIVVRAGHGFAGHVRINPDPQDRVDFELRKICGKGFILSIVVRAGHGFAVHVRTSPDPQEWRFLSREALWERIYPFECGVCRARLRRACQDKF